MQRIDVLALDIATCTGWARGAPGDIPTCGHMRFGDVESSQNAVFAAAIAWFSKFLEPEPRPTSIIIESMLPPLAMRGETSRATRDRLAGLHGCLRGVAHIRGVAEISDVSVLTVRKHFCGSQNASKSAVHERCRMLGWPVHTRDEGDACALWHYTCAIIEPKLAIEVSPLFRRRSA